MALDPKLGGRLRFASVVCGAVALGYASSGELDSQATRTGLALFGTACLVGGLVGT